MTDDQTAESLRLLLGPDKVSVDPDDLSAASHDRLLRSRAAAAGLPAPVLPMTVVRPGGTEDVRATVLFAAEHGIPIVELGGGTGLMGGARSIRAGIVIDLQSMNQLVAISAEDRTATVQAGAVLGDLDRALRERGLMLGHDPWTVPVATVGGTISTNSLGYRGARYGSMGDQVLGLEVVLGDGGVLRLRPAARSSTGPRLRHLFIGAEGVLGVITEATLRVFPVPERRRLVALEFPDFDSGFRAVQEMSAIGLQPAMIDYGQTYAGSRGDVELFTPDAAPGRMQLAFEGYREEVRGAYRRALSICAKHRGVKLPGRVAKRFWDSRHVDPERFRRRPAADSRDARFPDDVLFDFVHVSLPASRVFECRDRARTLLTQRGISIVEWGLWNQPELFSIVVQRHIEHPADAQAFAAALDEVLMLVQDLGGSMEYCHGAGLRLARLMEREHGRGLRLLQAIKQAVDPRDVLNPGKLGLNGSSGQEDPSTDSV